MPRNKNKLMTKKILIPFLALIVAYVGLFDTAHAFSIGGLVSSAMSFIGGLFGGGGGGIGGGGMPAVSNGGILPGPASAGDGITYVSDRLLPRVTNWVLAVVMSASVGVVIIGGLMYIFSGGDSEMKNKARDTIVWAIGGMVVAMLAYTIVRIVISINFLA